MKRVKLIKHLRKCGCRFVRHGGNHDIWLGPTGREAPANRTGEIKKGTVLGLRKQLGVPPPASAA